MPVSSNVSHHPKPHLHGRHLFLETQFLWHSNLPMLRHLRQVSSSFALRAAAHRAQSVRRVVAQSTTRRVLQASVPTRHAGFHSLGQCHIEFTGKVIRYATSIGFAHAKSFKSSRWVAPNSASITGTVARKRKEPPISVARCRFCGFNQRHVAHQPTVR